MDGSVNLRRVLSKAIDRLPDTDRLVLSLYYHDGLKAREIAAVLRVDEVTAAERVETACAHLRARVRVMVKDIGDRTQVMRLLGEHFA